MDAEEAFIKGELNKDARAERNLRERIDAEKDPEKRDALVKELCGL